MKQRVEFINEQIDHWLMEQNRLENQLDYVNSQLDRLIGEKTLRLVKEEDDGTIISRGR